MPSIRDLFADPDLMEEGEDTEIDIDKVLSSVTDVLNDRSATPGAQNAPAPEVVGEDTSGDTDESSDDGGDGEEPDEVEVPPPPSSALPPEDRVVPSEAPRVADPLLELPAERRAALLALDEAIMSNESTRAEVFKILSGDSAAPAQPTAVLPEHIDPESFEAQLWHRQQDQDRKLSEIAEATKTQASALESQRASAAAEQAGALFAQRYSGKLDKTDVLEIAQYAGTNGIAGMFVNTAEGRRNPVAAFDQALEHTLWTNEAFRTRVLDTGADETPPGEKPEAVDRKRKLKAISGAASPVSGPAPQRPPLETGSDGRLSEKSRQSLVKELANDMARQSQGSF